MTDKVTGLADCVPPRLWVELGFCDADAFAPTKSSNQRSHQTNRGRRSRQQPFEWLDKLYPGVFEPSDDHPRRFEPSDDHLATAAKTYSEVRLSMLDVVTATLSAGDAFFNDLLMTWPCTLTVLSQEQPEQMDALLLAASRDLLTDAKMWKTRPLVRWEEVVGNVGLPESLDSALAVGGGIRDGREQIEHLKSGRPHLPLPHSSDPRRELIADLQVAIDLDGTYDRQHEVAGARRQLRNRIGGDPGRWMVMIPWLLQTLGGGSRLLAEGTLWAMEAAADPFPALNDAAANDVATIRYRAEGLLGLLDGGNDEAALTGALARLIDRGRPVFPIPLAEPTSTWLSDLDLEAGLRSAISEAAKAFGEEFLTQAAAEEEGHVASLLTRIEERLRLHATVRALAMTSPESVELIGSYRRVPHSEERIIQADIALLIRIDIYGSLRSTFADFVQVKKTHREHGALLTDRWTIDLAQLDGLLTVSPTAVYWLISREGTIWVVPAKLVQGFARGKRVEDQGTFTLRYTDVRHCAVGLDSYFVDLASGGWLGSATDASVTLARGDKSRTVARNLFELSVRYSPG